MSRAERFERANKLRAMKAANPALKQLYLGVVFGFSEATVCRILKGKALVTPKAKPRDTLQIAAERIGRILAAKERHPNHSNRELAAMLRVSRPTVNDVIAGRVRTTPAQCVEITGGA